VSCTDHDPPHYSALECGSARRGDVQRELGACRAELAAMTTRAEAAEQIARANLKAGQRLQGRAESAERSLATLRRALEGTTGWLDSLVRMLDISGGAVDAVKAARAALAEAARGDDVPQLSGGERVQAEIDVTPEPCFVCGHDQWAHDLARCAMRYCRCKMFVAAHSDSTRPPTHGST
jgi:hypothetical protein